MLFRSSLDKLVKKRMKQLEIASDTVALHSEETWSKLDSLLVLSVPVKQQNLIVCRMFSPLVRSSNYVLQRDRLIILFSPSAQLPISCGRL